jgi:predicted nucleotide-binding protein
LADPLFFKEASLLDSDELFAAAVEFEKIAALGNEPQIRGTIQAIIDTCNKVHEAFSGSWLGYHASIYQRDLRAQPGARFDTQWGLREMSFAGGTSGQWAQYDRSVVRNAIFQRAGHVLETISDQVDAAERDFARVKGTVLSILSSMLAERDDSFLEKLKSDLEKVKIFSPREATLVYQPSGQFMTADTEAISGGVVTPAHFEVLGEAGAMATVFAAGQQGADIVRQAASHVERMAKKTRRDDRIGTNVFIGHGRSPLWRELKDFVEDRLRLPADEFNRVPVAGVTNIARLSEMLDAAAIGFVIMTAEDETNEGAMRARMNVIHEVGLFQGRLGFTRGIVMLEDGCEEFSNIQGLGQIRFPKGRISAAFEDVRQVLEREGILTS